MCSGTRQTWGKKPGVLSAIRWAKVAANFMLTEPKQFFLKVLCKAHCKGRWWIALLLNTTLIKACGQTKEMTYPFSPFPNSFLLLCSYNLSSVDLCSDIPVWNLPSLHCTCHSLADWSENTVTLVIWKSQARCFHSYLCKSGTISSVSIHSFDSWWKPNSYLKST